MKFEESVKNNLQQGRVIEIGDYSQFIPGKSSNGGAYIYYQFLIPLKNGKIAIEYDSSGSTNFDYCGKCGNWHKEEECEAEYEHISLEAAVEMILEAKNNKSVRVLSPERRRENV